MLRKKRSIIRFRRLALTVLGVLPLVTAVAQGQITYYSSAQAFDAATQSLTSDSFSGTGTVATGPYSNSPGVSVTTESGGTDNLYLRGATTTSGGVTPAGIAPFYFGDSLIFDFSPDDTAVAFNISGDPSVGTNQFGSSGTLIVDVYLQGSSSAHEQTYDLATFTADFVGVTSTTPISSVKLLYDYNADAYTDVSNVQYGATAVPEPSSVFFLCVGAAVFYWRKWRRMAGSSLGTC